MQHVYTCTNHRTGATTKKMHRAMTANKEEISGTALFGALIVAVALMIGFQPPQTEAPISHHANAEGADLPNADVAETKLVGVDSDSGNQLQ